MTSPPAIGNACPVIDCAADDAIHSAASATSCGSIGRPCGFVFASSRRASSSLRPVLATIVATDCATSGVSVNPGRARLTVTPVRASSSASARVSPMTPCLAAQ